MSTIYFTRQGRTGPGDLAARTPELRGMQQKTIAVFGLGCLGAPSALEFARTDIGAIRLLDHDIVDPATSGRWPFGLDAAGLYKVNVIADFLGKNYPATRVVPVVHCVVGIRHPSSDAKSDSDVVEEFVAGTSLIYDATAEVGVQHFLSGLAWELQIPYVAVVGTYGAWGGKVVSIIPGRTQGCWLCYRYACQDGTIAEPPSDPSGKVQPRGCAEVTFTGAGFDMGEVAIAGVRTAVAALDQEYDESYPRAPWDVLTMAFRNDSGQLIVPHFRGYELQRHPRCPLCYN